MRESARDAVRTAFALITAFWGLRVLSQELLHHPLSPLARNGSQRLLSVSLVTYMGPRLYWRMQILLVVRLKITWFARTPVAR